MIFFFFYLTSFWELKLSAVLYFNHKTHLLIDASRRTFLTTLYSFMLFYCHTVICRLSWKLKGLPFMQRNKKVPSFALQEALFFLTSFRILYEFHWKSVLKADKCSPREVFNDELLKGYKKVKCSIVIFRCYLQVRILLRDSW